MTEAEIKEAFVGAVKRFYDKEERMLKDDVCERALAFRLGLDVVAMFPQFTVHSEYNKAHDRYGVAQAKEIPGKIHTYPDLIVVDGVGQGSDSNILMVEIKKSKNKADITSDLDKLRWFTEPLYCYRYKVAAHLFFDKTSFLVVWYKDGLPVSADQWCFASGVWVQREISRGQEVLNYEKHSDVLTLISGGRSPRVRGAHQNSSSRQS